MRVRVKICCIQDEDEAGLAIRGGADAIGMVGPMPSGPGIISNGMIREIARAVSPPTATFLLTSERSAGKIVEHHQATMTSVIQLVDHVSDQDLADVRNRLPGVKLVQVIHVLDNSSIDEALAACKRVDALLLDSGNPHIEVKELGGTGRIHNWQISRQIVDQCDKPVFLAGGLNPENVARAVDIVQPFGVDVCSGLRTIHTLDEGKLEAFLKAIS